MRAPTEVRPEELREAHDAADTLISERFRSYLPGRMLPMLLGKFRDDVAESLGMELPPLPQRSGPVTPAQLIAALSCSASTINTLRRKGLKSKIVVPLPSLQVIAA